MPAFIAASATALIRMRAIASVAQTVVIADVLFTATTAVFQPPSALYAPAIGCWLPVLWIPAQLRDLAAGAALRGELLPAAYWRRFRA